MHWTAGQISVCIIGALHLGFMVGELLPWGRPKIMVRVVHKCPEPLHLSHKQTHFVAMVVHNAGIYNGIVAAGLFASVYAGPGAFPVQIALLAGGVVAGLFGAKTLTPLTIGQALVGAIALVLVVFCR